LYAGISAPLLTVGLVQSVNFAVYDTMRRLLYSLQQQHDNRHNYIGHDSMTNVAIASSTAGAVLALFTSPMLIVKTAQQTVPGLGLGEAMRNTWRTGLFCGFGPHFFSETIGRAVYFCSYESIKRELVRRRSSDGEPTLSERMMSAAASGTLCWAFIFPVDAIRSRIYYANAIQQGSLQSSWGMALEMYKTGGVRSFYRGFIVTVIRAGPVAAAVLPMYDKASEFLNQHL
jgi:solute carrier family 25 carnitine/acylcarnitine transporter 20/29